MGWCGPWHVGKKWFDSRDILRENWQYLLVDCCGVGKEGGMKLLFMVLGKTGGEEGLQRRIKSLDVGT